MPAPPDDLSGRWGPPAGPPDQSPPSSQSEQWQQQQWQQAQWQQQQWQQQQWEQQQWIDAGWRPGPWGWQPPLPKGGTAKTGPLPLHPMTVSDILDGAFKLLKANIRTIALITGAFVVPVQLLTAFLERSSGPGNVFQAFTNPTDTRSTGGDVTAGRLVASLVVLVLGLVITPFIAGAVSRVVSAAYVGAEETAGSALRATFRCTWALASSFVLVHVMEAVGLVLCVFPALAVMTMFVMLAPAIVVEGLGPIQGMRRSWRLAKGRFWPTLGIAVLAGLLTSLVSTALTLPFTILAVVLGDAGWIAVAVGGILASVIARPLVAVVATLQYYDGRIRTEGFDLQVIADHLASGAPA